MMSTQTVVNRPLQAARILLVEDSDDVRDAFAMLLRGEGAEVVAVATGSEAIGLARRQNFDVLLTDYGLPDVAGDALIREILTIARHRPHVVVVTGYGPPYVEHSRQAGADRVLSKPTDWPRLLQHLVTVTKHAAGRTAA